MVVIADDITGAAEIAGIAFQRGWQTNLVCGDAVGTTPTAGEVTVIATDTRSMTQAEAAAKIRSIATHLSPLTTHHSSPVGTAAANSSLFTLHSSLFKKTDSALRGHVVAELSALLECTDFRRAVYMPANPSKGRTISGGTYYINGKPIHETDFSFDPEFPALTSSLRERFPDAEAKGILMPDAMTTDDIRRTVETCDDGQTIFAGAADLFTALLEAGHAGSGRTAPAPSEHSQATSPTHFHSALMLCGSTQSRPQDLGMPVAPMPLAIYDGSTDLNLWHTDAYAQQRRLVLTIPHTHRTGKAVATHLRTMTALKAKALTALHRPDLLVIEGGATAWATLQALGWTRFEVIRQWAPGVIQLRAACGTHVVLKPGSYPFNFQQLFT